MNLIKPTQAGLVKKDYGSSKGFLEDTKVCACACVCMCPHVQEERNEETEHQWNQLSFSFGSFFDILSEAKI